MGILIRDQNRVYNTVEIPAILYDRKSYLRHKAGELSVIKEIHANWRTKFIEAGFANMADDLAVLELPPNQELMDQLFQSSGMLEQFIKEHVEKAI